MWLGHTTGILGPLLGSTGGRQCLAVWAGDGVSAQSQKGNRKMLFNFPNLFYKSKLI
jgi:hypothetical protein